MKKIIVMSVLLALVLTGCKLGGEKEVIITPEEASAKTAEYINENLMQPGTSITVNEVVEEGDLYKISITVPGGQEVDSYMTKDGKKLFPQAFELEEEEEENNEEPSANNQNNPSSTVSKSDKPKVELFVMSHCPYGTQIEKGIIPVVEALGDKIDFELKFCDYAMHGKTELDEQLEQYCVQKEEPNKLLSYLNCFLETGDESNACFSKVGIDKSKIDSCVASADKEFNVSENFDNKDTYKGRFPTFNVYKTEVDKYGVGGSPTLIVNGGKASSGRDSASLLSAICGAFNNAPEECSKQLSSASPSPGFGFGTASGGNNAAGCGQ